jgi:hypothetical protein
MLFNPDEGTMLAGSHRLFLDPVFWRSVDGTTGGPLLYYPLALLRLVGLPLNFATARFACLLSMWGVIVLLYLTGRLLMPEWAARISVLPLQGGAMQIRFPELVQYSSECIPMLLTAASVWLLARRYLKASHESSDWFVFGAILALMPFAKLQSVPLAAVIGAAGLALLYFKPNHRRWSSAGWLFAGGASVLLILLAALALFGIARDFYQSYILNNLLYAEHAEVIWTPTRLWDFLFHLVDMRRYFVWMGAFIAIVAARRLFQRAWRPSPPAVFAVCLALASFYAILKPGRPFWHYLLFLIVPLQLGVIAAFAAELSHAIRPRWIAAGFVTLTIVAPLIQYATEPSEISLEPLLRVPQKITSLQATRLSELTKPGDMVAIWGWAPEMYVMTGTVPATRDPHTQRQIEAGPQRAYYRQRFLADLRRSSPEIFVDAVGQGQRQFEDRSTQSIDSFPDLRQYLNANFDLVSDSNGVRMYKRRGPRTDAGDHS